MGEPLEPAPAVYTRRRVLASTAGVGAVAFLGRYQARQGAAPPSATLQVDFAETAFFPLLNEEYMERQSAA